MRDYTDKNGLKVAELLKAYQDKFGVPPYPVLVNKVDLEVVTKAGLEVTTAVQWVRPHYVFFGVKENEIEKTTET